MTSGLKLVVALKLVALASLAAVIALKTYGKLELDTSCYDKYIDGSGTSYGSWRLWVRYLALCTPFLLYCWFARQAWNQKSASKAHTAKNIAIVLVVVAAIATAFAPPFVVDLVWTIFAVYCADESAKKYTLEAVAVSDPPPFTSYA